MTNWNYEPSTWIPYLQLLVASISAVAWPLAIGMIAWRFWPEIRGLFPRIQQVGPSGVVLYPREQGGQGIDSIEEEKISNVEMEDLLDPVAKRVEENNRQALEEIEKEKREAFLLRALTNQQMQKAFAIVYSNIFGSQIKALEMLNTCSLSRAEAERAFDKFRADHPVLSEWNLDRYLRFLKGWDLVVEVDSKISITETGRNFLLFLTTSGLSKDRPN